MAVAKPHAGRAHELKATAEKLRAHRRETDEHLVSLLTRSVAWGRDVEQLKGPGIGNWSCSVCGDLGQLPEKGPLWPACWVAIEINGTEEWK
ncbi:hypothetical protein [Streptosporangium roseum]|uniref:hypothetical protein n=1 Tax=Streptosporangium roseum TaxID=2001 RepID=UPI0033185ED2